MKQSTFWQLGRMVILVSTSQNGLLSLFELFTQLGNCFFFSLENTTTSHELITSAWEFEISPSRAAEISVTNDE